MAQALAAVKTRRNITFELCAWGFGNVETFGPKFGHLWRTSPDISDYWESMLWNLDINDEIRYRQPGVQGPEFGWNYPDALFIGKGGKYVLRPKNIKIRFVLNHKGKLIQNMGCNTLTNIHLGMSTDEYRTMFALWCMVKSPLMLGSDLTLMTKEDEAYKIITNKWLLEINQDKLGNFKQVSTP